MKDTSKKRIIILALVIGFIVITTPILGTQINRIVKKNSLRLGYYTIESVECTDGFGYPTLLMVKSTLNTQYQTFPETILPFNYTTYYDNETEYICYGFGKYVDSIYTFTFDLDLKVTQDAISQTIEYSVVIIGETNRGSAKIWFGRLGGELLITFRLLSTQR